MRKHEGERHKDKGEESNTWKIILLLAVIAVIFFNQLQINKLSDIMENMPANTMATAAGSTSKITSVNSPGSKDLSNIDLSSIKGTGYSIAAVFPVENIKTAQDAMNMIIPTGMPDYGQAVGISYDEPVKALTTLIRVYQTIELSGAEQQRYLSLVTRPLGISCEYCCGLGAIGADSQGRSLCGCQHNPALLGLTKWLVKNTDYSDGEILREALRWKALFFPRQMVELTASLAGGDTTSLANLPGMVGGC